MQVKVSYMTVRVTMRPIEQVRWGRKSGQHKVLGSSRLSALISSGPRPGSRKVLTDQGNMCSENVHVHENRGPPLTFLFPPTLLPQQMRDGEDGMSCLSLNPPPQLQ